MGPDFGEKIKIVLTLFDVNNKETLLLGKKRMHRHFSNLNIIAGRYLCCSLFMEYKRKKLVSQWFFNSMEDNLRFLSNMKFTFRFKPYYNKMIISMKKLV